MKYLFLTTFFSFVLSVVLVTGQEYYSKADSEYHYGDLHKAIDLYTMSIKNNYMVPESFMMRGAAKSQLNDFLDAILDLDQANSIKKNMNKIYFYYGRAYFLNNLYDKAISYLDTAIDRDSSIATFFDYRAMAKCQTGNFEMAIIDENKAIDLDSTELEYFTNRGYYLYCLQKYKEALTDLNKSLSIEPSSLAYANRGQLYYKLGNYSFAIKDFTSAVDLAPEGAEIFYRRGLSYKALKMKKKACDDFRKSINMGFVPKDDIVCKYCIICK